MTTAKSPVLDQLADLDLSLKQKEQERERSLKQINDQIADLTRQRDEQANRLREELVVSWREIRTSLPVVTDKTLVEEQVGVLYDLQKWQRPDYVLYCQSPANFNRYGLGKYGETEKRHKAALMSLFEKTVEQDPFAGLYSQRLLHRMPLVGNPAREGLLVLLMHVVDLVPGKEACIVLEKPVELHLDPRFRLHRVDGPAIVWRDGYREWYLQGVKHSGTFLTKVPTIAQIRGERNQERRRLLLERYGYEEYLKDAKAELIGDDKFGKLWRIPPRRIKMRTQHGHYTDYSSRMSEPEVWVEVENATNEPDNTVRRFFLRVPPTTTTPKAAVAWTFGKKTKEYQPKAES